MASNNQLTTILTSTGEIKLTPEIVKAQLVRGGGDITNEEVAFFLEYCKAGKLNPFANEAYLVKFKGSPAQVITSVEAYKRRAEENPNHISLESGVVIDLGNGKFEAKKGSASYGRKVVAGWAKVLTQNGNVVKETYKDVDMTEYNKGTSTWKQIPNTMIEKVAISQALRQAYPSDFNGTYTQEEYPERPVQAEEAEIEEVAIINEEQRHMLFEMANKAYGKDGASAKLKQLLVDRGYESTTKLPVLIYEDVYAEMQNVVDSFPKPVREITND